MKRSNKAILSFDVDGQRVFDFLDHLEKDYFLEEGLPRAVDFLKRNNLDATFFTVGKNIEEFPDVHRELKDFDIGNHTYSHPYFLTQKSSSEKQIELEKAHSIIEDFYGVTPKMFRAPDYQIDSELINILKDMGYQGDSSMIKVLVPPGYFINCIKQRSLLQDDFEIPLTSFIIPFNGTSVIFLGLRIAKLIFECLLKFNKVINLNFHARDFVNMKIDKPGFWRREKALETSLKFLEYVNERSNIMSFRQFFNASHTEI